MTSIVITAYNVAETIEKAVRSALGQRGFAPDELEVVVVEDCSTDETPDILKRLAAAPHRHRLHILQNAQNLGAGLSRRVGITYSKGERILLLDGDDTLTPGFVRALYDKAVETGAEIVSGGITVLRANGVVERTTYGEYVVEGIDKVKRHFGERIIFMNNKLIHRRLHDLIPYCHRRYIEDTPTIVPMLAEANRVAYVNHDGYRYLMRSTSLTHTVTPLKNILFRALCMKDLIEYFKDWSEEWREMFPVKGYREAYALIAKLKPTPEDIEPWKDEWAEFFQYLVSTEKV